MRPSGLLAVLATAVLAPQAYAQCAPHPVTLAAMHDCNRVLLVFAPRADDPKLQQQMDSLEAASAALRERDLLIVPILLPGASMSRPQTSLPTATLTPEDEAKARSDFHRHGSFEVVLLGKDGGEKMRSSSPVGGDQLDSKVDSMPMRQQEMQPKP